MESKDIGLQQRQ